MRIVMPLAAALALAACGERSAEAPAQAPTPVRVAEAVPARPAPSVEAAGTLLFKKEMTLSFKVGGVIQRFDKDTGDAVKKGDLLALLVPTEIAARQREAQAAFDQAQNELKRAQELKASGNAAQARVDAAAAGAARAKAALEAVTFDRTWAELRAPGDGIVLDRMAEANQVIAPGVPVMSVADASGGLIMNVPVSDAEVVRIAVGAQAEIEFDALPGVPVKARVARIAGKSDPRTGTFDVELAIENPPAGLRSGMIGGARISTRPAQGASLSIPAAAILEGQAESAAVFVLEGDTVRRVAIRVSAVAGDVAIVSAGLTAGDQVVTAGAPYLRDNARVVVVAPDAESAS